MSPSPSATLHILIDSAAALAGLPEGAEARFWMTDRGPDSRPALVVVPTSADRDAAIFKGRVAHCIGHSPTLGAAAHGTARRMKSGVVLISRSAPDAVLSIHAALCASALLAVLPAVTAVQMRGSSLSASATGANLSEQARVLESGRGVFYLLIGRELKTPRLLLADDGAGLKARVAAEKATITGKTRGVRGKLRRSSRGYVELRTRQDDAGTLAALIAWTAAHQSRWSALTALHGARLTILGSDGEIADRRRDDAAWRAIA